MSILLIFFSLWIYGSILGMKTRIFPFVVITKKQEKSIRHGHLWVYEDEITEQSQQIENGSIVDIFTGKGTYLGSGLYSADSKIRVRILGNNPNETYGDAFFQRKVQYAIAYRREIMKEDFQACRLIHGEADGLPGLTVDRYNNILVAEVNSFGIEQRKELIYETICQQIGGIDGIYERNDSSLRSKEGLSQYSGWYKKAEQTVVRICENGIYYDVDVEEGQKTGFFLDQKYNRMCIQKLAEGKNVLDCCTHTGSFALNAAKGGAKSVLALDISSTALDCAKKNAQINHLDVSFEQGDVFEMLQKKKEEHAGYDLIILDPPAFTKARKTAKNAYQGYLNINRVAMEILNRGGYLATCSCSHFMSNEMFREMLVEASCKAQKGIRIVEERHAAPDHPVLPAVNETEYLKFYLIQMI